MKRITHLLLFALALLVPGLETGAAIYVKVSAASQLAKGDEILFVNEEYGQAYGGVTAGAKSGSTATYYGKAVSVSISDNTIVDPTGVQPLQLGKESGNWTFYDAGQSKYLGWDTSYSNKNIKSFAVNSAVTKKTQWTISFSSGVVTVKSTLTTENEGCIRYYPGSSSRFSVYPGSTSTKDICIYKKATDLSVTIGKSGYATLYYSLFNLQVPEGVEAHTYKVSSDGTLSINRTYSPGGDYAVIPAGEPVVLYDGVNAEKTYLFTPVVAPSYEKDADNVLLGSDVAAQTVNKDGTTDGYFYKLSSNNGENAGFYWGAEGGKAFTIAAHKAYLAMENSFSAYKSSEQPKALKLFDVSTSIGKITAAAPAAVRGIYTLSGMRLSDCANLPSGLYIINGKKVCVR